MNYLNKLEELISKESVTKESINKINKPNIANKNEKFFTEEEKDILTRLHITKKGKKVIEDIKDIFGRSSRVIKGYKININNSTNPIEKVISKKIARKINNKRKQFVLIKKDWGAKKAK